jgi:hypothetical protein
MSGFNIINELAFLFPKFITYINKLGGKSSLLISKKEIGDFFLDFLIKEGSWDKPGNKTNFNQIQKMMNLGVAKHLCRNQNDCAYLELANNTKFNIRKQDEFHFKLIGAIYKRLKKLKQIEITNELFVESPNEQEVYVNSDLIQIEKTERTNDSNYYRTDMSINVKSNIIVIEYLEKQHEKERSLDYPFEKYRAFNLMFDNKNTDYKIIHIAYYWEHQYYDKKYFEKFIHDICKKIIDYWDISNEDTYCMRKLAEIIGNKTLAEQIYKAHTNRYEPVVNLKTVESIIDWNKKVVNKIPVSKLWYNTFVDRVKIYVHSTNKINQNKNEFDDFDSDTDSDSDNLSPINKEITHEMFYKIIEKEIYLTQAGLHLYLRVDINFLSNIEEYVKISKFYENITQGLVDILKDFRDKEIALTKHYFTGLEF